MHTVGKELNKVIKEIYPETAEGTCSYPSHPWSRTSQHTDLQGNKLPVIAFILVTLGNQYSYLTIKVVSWIDALTKV